MSRFATLTGSAVVGQETIGARLLRARLEHGSRLVPPRVVTQLEVGKEMGVSGVAVGAWEADRSPPTIETVRALARLYGVRVGWIIEGELPMREGEGHQGAHHTNGTPAPVTDPSAYDRPAKQQPRQITTTRVEPAPAQSPKRRKPGGLAAFG